MQWHALALFLWALVESRNEVFIVWCAALVCRWLPCRRLRTGWGMGSGFMGRQWLQGL